MSHDAISPSPGRSAGAYFDSRAETYDDADIHHHVAAILANGADLRPGHRVLDVATGTGILAFIAARKVGPTGLVLGMDISERMLAKAREKARRTDLTNIVFSIGDADNLAIPEARFDHVMAASALAMMPDIPRALRGWFAVLKPGGAIAFDVPGTPFGLGGRIAEAAALHGVRVDYAQAADTHDKCRSLLTEAGFAIVAVRRGIADATPVGLDAAVAFFDGHLQHPAWRALKDAPIETRHAIRATYVADVTEAAINGCIANDTALNFVFGRKPVMER